MALSRKREKELARLRSAVQDLWEEQRDVLDNASRVAREASRQALNVGREELAPRVRDAFENQVRPAVHHGAVAARSAAASAKDHLAHDVLPSVSATIGSLLALHDVAKDPHVRETLARIGKSGAALKSKGNLISHPAKTMGFGRYALVTFAIIASVGVAYAAWQTLRADDELWVTDEPEVSDATIPSEAAAL